MLAADDLERLHRRRDSWNLQLDNECIELKSLEVRSTST